MYYTKNTCVHKAGGESSIKVIEKISGNKFKCMCVLCKQEQILKRKQVPVDAEWEIAQ